MNQLMGYIENAATIGIAGHIRPDGDCVGSCMGLYHYILDNFQDKKVDVFLESVPRTFAFLKGTEHIITDYPDKEPYDLFIALDSSSFDRLGKADAYFKEAKMTVCVDHHISNTAYAKETIVDAKASSTCEVLFEQLEEDKINHCVAEPLYIGIIFDTAVFKHSNTSPRTMCIGGILMGKGVEYT